MSRHRPVLAGLAVAAAGVAVVAVPGAASADTGYGTPTVRTLNSTVLAPYQLTIGPKGLYVGEGGTSTVGVLGRDGKVTTVARGPQPGEVAGVAWSKQGDLAYTTLNYATGATTLTVKQRNGHTRKVDLSGFEERQNPDAAVHYGIDNPTPCQEEAFAPLGGATYTGLVDSHAYAVASLGNGEWVVADAGGNDLIKIGRTGPPKVLSVLPRQATTITAEAAAGLGLPDCVVGAVYHFEPVPTDVEVGKDGKLVVSLLPGGPEDPSLGARGSVYTVSKSTGKATRVAGGFLGATNVALDDKGRIFVAELFAGQVSVIERGSVRPYVSLPAALSLVWSRGTLYAGTIAPTDEEGNPTGTGSLVAIK
jgi:hypothetical protein